MEKQKTLTSATFDMRDKNVQEVMASRRKLERRQHGNYHRALRRLLLHVDIDLSQRPHLFDTPLVSTYKFKIT